MMSDQPQTTATQERPSVTLPVVPEPKSEVTTAVQPEVQKEVERKTADKRQKILEEAGAALKQTKEALVALDRKDTDRALQALAEVTGKLELILARDPELALAPVEVHTVVHDLFASTAVIEDLIDEALRALKNDEVQTARRLLAGLASEIVITTTNIPLATYPQAIKAVAPLIDSDEIGEAKAALQAVLGTLIETHDIISLPVLRARLLLTQAEPLAETDERSEQQAQRLAKLLGEVRNQLQMAELLGYGRKGDFGPIYEQIKEIEQKSGRGKSGKGWFHKIKEQISELF